MIVKYTYSAKDTISLGKKFSRNLSGKDVVVLEGALGGGKTTFIKGILRGFKIKDRILSPTFTLMRHYDGKKISVYHIDLYRIDEAEIFGFGMEDFLYAKKTITLIEWGEKIEKCLPNYIKIYFQILGEEKRKITFSSKKRARKNLFPAALKPRLLGRGL